MSTAPILGVPPEAVEYATDERERRAAPSIDSDRERKLLYITEKLLTEGLENSWEERKRRALNREYYRGNTKAAWDPIARRITSSTRRQGDGSVDPAEFVSFNVVQPAVDIFTSAFAGATPVTEVEPGTPESMVIEQARACNAWLNSEWDRLNMSRLYYETAKACVIDGEAYWEPWFDHTAGKFMGISMEDGVPRAVHEGELKADLHLADNIIEDPTSTCIDDCGYIIKLTECSPRKVYESFNVQVSPDGSSNTVTRRDKKEVKKSVQVRTLYLRRGLYPASDDGKTYVAFETGMVIISTKSKVLFEGPMRDSRYPFPLIHFRCLIQPGEFHGRTPLDILRVAQGGLDMTFTQWVASNRNVAMPKWLKPVECDVPDADWNDVPGAVLRYSAVSGAKPELVPGRGLDYSVQALVQFLMNEYIPHAMGQHQGGLAGGNTPGVESGYHYSQIVQHDFARQNPMARELTCGIERWGDMCLEIAASEIPEERLITAVGATLGWQMSIFSGEKVDEKFRVRVRPESTIPQTKEQKLQRAAYLMQLGLIKQHDAAQRVGEEPGEDPTLSDLHIALARKENFELFYQGKISLPIQVLQERDRGMHAIHLEQVQKLLADPTFNPQENEAAYNEAINHMRYHFNGVANDMQLDAALQQMSMPQPPPGEGTPSGPPPQ